jgi:hypothetical protein
MPSAAGSNRATESVLLADLCVTIGGNGTAAELLTPQGSTEPGVSGMNHPLDVGPSQLALSVLVRSGRVDVAFDVARKITSTDLTRWITLGAMCSFCDYTEELQKQLDIAQAASIRCALALGAAFGFEQIRSQEEQGSKPPTENAGPRDGK